MHAPHLGGHARLTPDGQGGWVSWADADYATRERMYQDHVAWQLGMLWYIHTDARYRALTPKAAEAENLLVTWALSLSHVAFGSMRMEPCHMVLSQSAATALCLDHGLSVQELPYPLLKKHLLADGQILGDPVVADGGIIVDNSDASGFQVSGDWTGSSASGGGIRGVCAVDIKP